MTHRRPIWLSLFLVLVCTMAAQDGASADHLSISGTLWQDLNADGEHQPDEPGIEQWPVSLRSQAGDRTEARTGPGGRYTFGGLDAGGYSVEVEFHGQAPPWLMTHPALSYEPPFARPVALAGTSATNQDFGLHAPFGLPQFMGLAWVDAAPADLPEVRALIGGVDCTGPAGIMPPDMDAATYGLTVLSDALKPGCGEPGDTISFTIDVHNANETAVWQPIPAGEAPLQDGRGMLTLTAGAPFAYLYPRLQQVVGGELRDAVNRVVIALIGDQVCGTGLTRVWGGHLLAVPSSEQAPGCGEPDAAVRFAVDGFAVPDTIVWSPGAHEGFTFTLQPSPDAATAGPAFAYFTFELAVRPPDYVGQPEQFIEALVDGVTCGSAARSGRPRWPSPSRRTSSSRAAASKAPRSRSRSTASPWPPRHGSRASRPGPRRLRRTAPRQHQRRASRTAT